MRDETDFERRLEQLVPQPLDAVHRTATLARADVVGIHGMKGRTGTLEGRRLLAAALAVLILVVLRGVALTALTDTVQGSAQIDTQSAARWATYVQRIHALELAPRAEATPERQSPSGEEDGPQAKRVRPANRRV